MMSTRGHREQRSTRLRAMILGLCISGCATGTGSTVHTLECRPVLEVRKVEDRTRIGWHNELWLIVDGASMPIGEAAGHAPPQPPIPLDPAKTYTFTVERIESFSEVTFSLVSIAEGGKTLWISRGEALRIALAAFIEAAPGDDWYRPEHLRAMRVKREDRLFWAVSCSGHPIAGGGGSVLVNATSGEVVDLHIPPGSR